MEYEMKAKITKKQLMELLYNYLPANDTAKFLIKADRYFSFGGIEPKEPKQNIRLRDEVSYSFRELLKEKRIYINDSKAITELLQTDWDDLLTSDDRYCLLTIKEKKTLEDSEMNEEHEGKMDKEAGMAFRRAMKIANFQPYFIKNKNSISFYIEESGWLLHCEIVSVNGSDIYLEVECCTGATDPTDTIREFMFKLGINKADTRSWSEIIKETSIYKKTNV